MARQKEGSARLGGAFRARRRRLARHDSGSRGMKIYFMGVGGTAMGNAALLARAAGHEVLGADTGVYPPMSTVLAAAAIEVYEGYEVVRLARAILRWSGCWSRARCPLFRCPRFCMKPC